MAQPTITGCVVPLGQLVYTQTSRNGDVTLFNGSPSVDLSGQCYSSSTAGTPCTICMNGLNNGGNCPPGSGNPTAGTIKTFTILDCPLDNSLFLLVLCLGGLSFFFLRKKNLSLYAAA
ncbi:hypothetical protein HDC90_000001 [Pedobacter sp. AK013]|uniref:hypothetical protein n=1 Tax=Pedobacter sp. AK013 TaxID=2723071 RepID=UPI00161ED008|nr:hypothetical protein [Pedobacter sp. AK013]MBB6235404.1 hypothetical protein [Pedobacter sp. AK013]